MTVASRQIIVNADDLGISQEVNEAIFDAHDRGMVTSATLLVGAPAVEHALDGMQLRPRLGVGVHLDTSEFGPMSPDFDDLRRTKPTLDVRTSKVISPSAAKAIASEWRAQIDRATALGVSITHVDSHHFDHVNPVLLPSLIGVARTTNIVKVRGMHNLWVHPPHRTVRLIKTIHRRAMTSFGIATTDYMCDVGSFLHLAESGLLPPTGTFELMAHPGHEKYAAESKRLLDEGPELLVGKLVDWRSIGSEAV